MNRLHRLAILITICMFLVIPVKATELNWLVVSGSGVEATSASYRMNATIGQSAVGESGSAGYVLNLGFWQRQTSGCCVGVSGNLNGDPGDAVDITDLTKMVNHLFLTFEVLPCPGEGNTNGDGACAVDITDLTKLVNHLFLTFEPLAPCAGNCGK